MNPFRSVGARLSFALAVAVAASLGLVYLVVVPSLERNLVDSRLSELERAAPLVVRSYRPVDPDWVLDAASAADARAAVYAPVDHDTLLVFEDSRFRAQELENDPLALRAYQSGELRSGTVTRDGTRFAEVAVPLPRTGYILLLSSSLRDSLANVSLVQRRLLEAGALALVIALGAGYGAAWLFARRIRRLERAADRIAAGSFDEPVVDPAADELGELARAFERMRNRLALLDHARREFIANASHELRTPLFSLSGFLELLADEELDDRTREEFLATMREQVDRLTKLATELLDLSRLDAGRISIGREPLDLAELAAALADEFRGAALARGHELEVDSGPATGLGDPARARQIGSILLENALLHTPPGTSIRLRTARLDGSAELLVEDTGPGIPAEHQDQVFDRFYRIEGSVAHGSGLGLAIARELAELMGGRIELESRPGRTVFRLVLPAAVEAAERQFAPVS